MHVAHTGPWIHAYSSHIAFIDFLSKTLSDVGHRMKDGFPNNRYPCTRPSWDANPVHEMLWPDVFVVCDFIPEVL